MTTPKCIRGKKWYWLIDILDSNFRVFIDIFDKLMQ